MKLQPIKEDDLIFTSMRDRIFTFLKLDDYDWMKYTLTTKFYTKNQGMLDIKFQYFGTICSEMTVEKTVENQTTSYHYSYPTTVFKRYLKRYLQEHIDSWKSTYAFYGGNIVLDFYNEIVTKYKEEDEDE